MTDKKHKSFSSLFEELNGVPLEAQNPEYEEEGFDLTDEMDHMILMHRDAHFGGDFQVMLDYYQSEAIGIDPDIDYDRICYLQRVEQELGQNLAPLMLSAGEAEQVGRCRTAYTGLKEVYETEQDDYSAAQLVADLILSEEEEPIQEIEAVCQYGAGIVPLLIDLIRSDDAYSALFPGYGYAPYLAAICLGKLHDPRALIPLFEMFHKQAIFDDEALLEAFEEFGEPAKQFLLQRVKGKPITLDNTHAAFALCVFSSDLEVSSTALELLKDADVQRHSLLSTYLLCLCEALQTSDKRQDLITLCDNPKLPKEILLQIKNLVRDWH
ncbi:MAG: hypothetical protein JSS62_04440 [Verrucomicrobia bacterium]|nr:hypothetical protein [Verrucomicrobiota bacterium]MBS0646294.1 hypothetical protein [Verrucomicrobiota bacterium]